jgi:trimeric autotransporter adhesin
MISARKFLITSVAAVLLGSFLNAQQSVSLPSTGVPRLVNFSGKAVDAQGKTITGIAGVTFAIYADQFDGAPLWMETQNVQGDAKGNYTVQLGSTKPEGLPLDLFLSGEARWLGARINDNAEQPRVLLLSVPYALKAADAETLGGKPASAFMAAPVSGAGEAGPQAAQAANTIVCSSGTACKTGFVPLFSSNGGSAAVKDSILSQSGTAMTIVGTASATGTISSGGDLDASGNVNANGNVGASTVTTVALTGGVNSTLTGTGNSIAAVEGSATATGAAGFTFGVIGQSASANGRGVFGLAPGASGVGVIGETTGSTGIGVTGKTLNGQGWAFSATGNAQQDRGSGGWAKALVTVNGGSPPYTILRCFNSTLPGSIASVPPCGFNLLEQQYAVFNIDFGFEVDDRFWSVSAEGYFVGGDNGAIIANAYAAPAGFKTMLQVATYTDSGNYQGTTFTVVIF